jgi:bacteriorhodopsin|tara:strand:+ start:207 stop:962 length:756 start_codon:yes stop_codon:yes gene_type:complete
MENLNIASYDLLYNLFSFTFAAMMAATLFFWLNLRTVSGVYRSAIVVTGLVTFIAAYHYFQMFLSFENAFIVNNKELTVTGRPFNHAYRYVDWLLTVPLLLVELILVMNLSQKQTINKGTTLGIAAVLMIILGYPGEMSSDLSDRFFWWSLAMIPFLYIVFVLFIGLKDSILNQPVEVRGQIKVACWVTIISWSFYPVVYLLPNFGLTGGDAYVGLQVGYSIADIVSKAGFGVLIYIIAYKKSKVEGYSIS